MKNLISKSRRLLSVLAVLLPITAAHATSVVAPLVQVSNDGVNHQQEPSVVRGTTGLGVDVTTTAYMTWTSSSTTAIQTIAKTVSGQTVPNTMLEGDLTNSGDPVLAFNPYTTAYGSHRTYLAGIQYNTNAPSSRLTLWRSDDGGKTPSAWSAAKVVEDGVYFYDKPSVTVSPSSATRGHVYVAALRGSDIVIFRSVDGGVTFDKNGTFLTGSQPTHSPVVSVDYYTASIYIFFADWSANKIRVVQWNPNASGSAAFTEMPQLSIAAQGGTLMSYPNDVICLGASPCIAAPSMIAVRYNWSMQAFGVVWHQRLFNGDVDVKLGLFYATYQTPLWGAVQDVPNSRVGEQWHPALDFDDYGDWLISYYDRGAATPGTLEYRMLATKVFSYGAVEWPDYDIAAYYTADAAALHGATRADGKFLYTMGDYHDIWYTNGQWVAAFIYARKLPTGTQPDNVYFSYIQP